MRRRLLVRGTKRITASGKARHNAAAREVGAVVVMLTVTTKLPLPDGTCGGLKLHDANAGKPEHARLTLFGKFPGVGFTFTVNKAVLPRTTATVAGVAEMEKLKFEFGVAIKLSATECVVAPASVPTALTLNEYVFAAALLTLTVNGTPEPVGTIAAGATLQLDGAPFPQLRATLLLYPFTAVTTPSKVAAAFTWAVKVGLDTVKV